MVEVNAFVELLIESNVPKLKNCVQVKYNRLIQFKEISECKMKVLIPQ